MKVLPMYRAGLSLVTVTLAAVATTGALASMSKNVFDFSEPRAEREWTSINDTVMGGMSSSRLEPTGEGTVVFAGDVSLANNGGFASVRSRARKRDMTGFAGLALRVRGDGRRYKVNLKNDANLDGVLYRAAFDTIPGEWQTVRLRFEEFVPTFRGRLVPGAGPINLGRVISFGLMVSDKQVGEFRLELARIDAFSDGVLGGNRAAPFPN